MSAKNKETSVYIEKRNCYAYPSPVYYFNPSQRYPEYPFGESLSPEENTTYDMVRACLRGMGMDTAHYGTPEWNPLGEIIQPGNHVVLKPNMVMHRHLLDESLGLDSVITNPAVVRAVADYCIIALKGSGKLVIGDAPLQSCDLDVLVSASGYDRLMAFYKAQGRDIGFKDFRLIHSKKIKKMGITLVGKIEDSMGDSEGYRTVDIGRDSMLMDRIDRFERLRVTNYDPVGMRTHHNPEKNEYIIPYTILDADVVINISKPKSHRKAGITAAMKNLVGINGHKDWLPHHTRGPQSEGGDEYPNKSLFKKLHTTFTEKADIASIRDRGFAAIFWGFASRVFRVLSSRTSKDRYYEGSWYGNDTIWRTICDLNRILMYSDKQGVLQPTCQRTFMQLGDMIVSGEGGGPMEPTPKKVGVIAGAMNPLAFDTAICAMMGMDWQKVPSVCGSYEVNRYPIAGFTVGDVRIHSSDSAWDNVVPKDVTREKSLKYVPTKGWKGHIELEG